MDIRAIALSQVDGVGGESVGRGLAERLGFGYLHESVIVEVATDQGLDPATVAEAERRRSFLERLARSSSFAGLDAMATGAALYAVDQSDEILGMIRDAVRDAAGRGKVVLVGHAATFACADRADVLRVCVTASFDSRVSRVAADRGIDKKDATKWLRQSDAGRLAYLKRVYDMDGESPTDYDIVVNTDRVDSEAAIEAVLVLAQAGDRQR